MFNRAMTAAAALLLLAACSSHRASNAPSVGAAPASAATAGSGSSAGISEARAKAMIEQDGYSGLKNLRQTGDGGWTGNATANGKPVTVMVAPDGSIRTH
ncbi:MAG TPA: hypothetical protein VJ747_06930 [Stellaceae bacterium]|nr:hypothetical protein [Stellaceae bacterium]